VRVVVCPAGGRQERPLIHLCHHSASDSAAVDLMDQRLALCEEKGIRRKALL
jgi:hypothetical protein